MVKLYILLKCVYNYLLYYYKSASVSYLFMSFSLLLQIPGGTSSLALTSPGSASGSAQKKNSSRRNAWGNLSYADLITQAISSASDNRLTLSQIYEWMVQNVPYFKDKGDSNSSAGWKVGGNLVFSLLIKHKYTFYLLLF